MTRETFSGSKPRIEQLEMHVSHACNLHCESCSHYSNQSHKGNVSLDDADVWMSAWSSRIQVGIIKLVGGEPTIHPQLAEFPTLARRHWPDAEIWIITNGFFLLRHPELPRAMIEAGNCRLMISIHHQDRSYMERIEPALQLLSKWEKDHGISVERWPAHARWTRRYNGFGHDMLPFDDRSPRKSWENCAARHSPQLFDGSIWKCPPIAYLRLQKLKYAMRPQWDPYLTYMPLAAHCTDEDLHGFLALEDEQICAMCSAHPARFELKNPLYRP